VIEWDLLLNTHVFDLAAKDTVAQALCCVLKVFAKKA